MKCKYCGKEYSPKVMRIHAPLCKAKHETEGTIKMDAPLSVEEYEKELRAKAKAQGIKNWHNKKIENLLKEVL